MTITFQCLVWLAVLVGSSSQLQAQNSLETNASSHIDDLQVDFRVDILPLLSNRCFPCHGPDESHREAGLRLDQRGEAIDFGAIVPGSLEESELIQRIRSENPELRMPPPESNRPLDTESIAALEAWIKNGAVYEQHWSFVPPQKRDLKELATELSPANKQQLKDRYQIDSLEFQTWYQDRLEVWPENEIDLFIRRKMLQHGLAPSEVADRYTLIRRLSFDLIGLPPSPDEVQDFINDESVDAYERLVERLLSSPAYGEHWGRKWLDLARYADTNGYEKDRPRSIWPYRDWVIDSLNQDYPFDEFSIDQLAGDMRQDADEDSLVATGFHRNTMLNEEGGIDPLEYRYYSVVDRVATTGLTWMGITTGCAQCHTHKYDPISHEDYYQLMGFLNNADELEVPVPDSDIEARQQTVDAEIAKLVAELPKKFPASNAESGAETTESLSLESFEVAFRTWFETQHHSHVNWQLAKPGELKSNLPKLEGLPDGSIYSSGDVTKRDEYELEFELPADITSISAIRVEVMADERLPAAGPGRCYYEGRKGAFFLSELTAQIGEQSLQFEKGSVSYGKIGIGGGDAKAENVFDGDGSTGWATAGGEGKSHQLVLNLKTPLVVDTDKLRVQMLFERHFAASLGRFRIWVTQSDSAPMATQLPVEEQALFAQEFSQLSEAQTQQLRKRFALTCEELAEARKPIEELRKRRPKLPTTLILEERPTDNPRSTFLHHRGEYLSPRQELQPGLPKIFADQLPESRRPGDRLEFASWLVSNDNPLVARVVVNRAWRELLGKGLMETDGDYGTQAAPPSHPELLDWLAVELMESGWSLKHLHHLIVTSATYRQSSKPLAATRAADPDNHYYAYANRVRLNAESIRDMALSVSGALQYQMGGPGVYPPQPASVTALAYGATPWRTSKGGDRFRRSIYTFRKRTAPFAAYDVFDGPSGEFCLARRNRSNTPLQALTLLNDEMFVELARELARDTISEVSSQTTSDDDFPIDAISLQMFRRVLTRPPTAEEQMSIRKFYAQQLQRFEAGELSASEALGRERASNQEAACFLLARVLLNLDESVTRP